MTNETYTVITAITSDPWLENLIRDALRTWAYGEDAPLTVALTIQGYLQARRPALGDSVYTYLLTNALARVEWDTVAEWCLGLKTVEAR